MQPRGCRRSRTDLGKGSLYHFFPGGKAEMADAVLANLENWCETNIFRQRETGDDSSGAIYRVFDAVEQYFCSGQCVRLVGAMALDSSRDSFVNKVSAYFEQWSTTLSGALQRSGFSPPDAERLSYEVIRRHSGSDRTLTSAEPNGHFLGFHFVSQIPLPDLRFLAARWQFQGRWVCVSS
jgi:AcrR family transcriptional regulator